MMRKKRILLVHCHELSLFPPVLSLLQNLLHNKHDVTLIAKDDPGRLGIVSENFRMIQVRSPRRKTAAGEIFLHGRFQKQLRRIVRSEMAHHDILWTTTDCTVRELGKEVLEHCHIMQLLELIQDIPLFPYQNKIMFHIETYAKKAWKVVVPEYNRACIQQAWWKLDRRPVVLPNKPYELACGFGGAGADQNRIRELEEEMRAETRKILLYQGVFETDRDLTAFAEAVRRNRNHYCLYIMGRENDLCRAFRSRFPEVKYIPFLPPPMHLSVTRNADFGILPYIPEEAFHYSPLNALYCAPNKIFEYAAFGLPMLGTRVPGLEVPFSRYRMGICCERDPEEITKALETLSMDYDTWSRNSHRFYDSVDLDRIVEDEILEEDG